MTTHQTANVLRIRGNRICLFALLFFVLAHCAVAQSRASLLPQLHTGQKLTYQIRLRINKQTRAESRVATPQIPPDAPVDILRTITAEVLDVAPENPRAHLILALQLVDPAATTSPHLLNLSIASDGSAVPSKGAEELSAEDTQAWKAWLDRFVTAWTVPAKTPKLGDKWTAEEPISGAPLAAISWQKESQYLRDEKCPAAISESDRCAILVTTASLKQRSSPKDTTPADFKQRQLKTAGTAKGRNEAFIYISLANGLVLRSSEEAHQFMDVVIAKADGSNQVHYNIDASSSTEVLLVPATPAN